MTVSSYNIAPGASAEEIAARRKMAMLLMQQGADTSPVQAWTQGAARALQAGLGGWDMGRLDKEDREERAKGNALLAALFAPQGGGGVPAGPMSAGGEPVPPPGPVASTPLPPPGGAPTAGVPLPPPRPTRVASLGPPPVPVQQATEGIIGMEPRPQSDPYRTPLDASRPPQNQVVQAFQNPTGPQLPPPSAPAAQPNGMNPAAVTGLLGNRYTAPLGQQIIGGAIQQQFKPSEYDFKERPDGSIIAINKKNPNDMRVLPGNPQDIIRFKANLAAAEKEATMRAEKGVNAPERREQELKVGNIVTDDIDRAIKLIDTAKLPTTGSTGALLSNIGGTAARDVRALVDTVKANAGFAELQKMRQNSPTGGALGQVSEREIAYLQATIGNLEQSQSVEQFKYNLRRVKNAYLDIIHGPGNGPREKLENSIPDGWTVKAR